jgi:hypothetical protein
MSYHHPLPGALRGQTQAPDLGVLQDFCKEELAAAQTYEKALTLPVLAPHLDVLERCYASHKNRAAELAERIANLGGEPPNAPGVWGSLLPSLATAAAALSEKLAISLLEESEGRGQRRYRDQLPALEPPNQSFVTERIQPAQDVSYGAITEVGRALQA